MRRAAAQEHWKAEEVESEGDGRDLDRAMAALIHVRAGMSEKERGRDAQVLAIMMQLDEQTRASAANVRGL